MIAVTHGVRRNVGDALIHDRALSVLRAVGGGHEFLSVDRERAASSAIPSGVSTLVCAGGPGLRSDAAETAFPVIATLAEDIPVFMLAQGYGGAPRLPSASYFSDATLSMLRNRVSTPVSVRDLLTLQFCREAGIEAVMTGCVAWYHMASLGKPMAETSVPERIVFTPPAGPRWAVQSVQMLRVLRGLWPQAELLCSFHRGIAPGNGTSAKQAASYAAVAVAARLMGAEIYDASGSHVSSIGRYRSYDLHVGYRVHAHLDFLSRRHASILIAEDGRGYGQQMTLNDPYHLDVGDVDLAKSLKNALATESSNGWAASREAISVIDASWPVMQNFVHGLLIGP